MSLFGSLFSGVSALASQSQAMGIIGDNLSNVNTVGYKATAARFATLVTTPATDTTFTPGGVQVRPIALVGQQGLLQASSSPTDLGISGQGFFVVNGQVDSSGEPLYTRAGSFHRDNLGNLVNTSGFYLQGWKLDPGGLLPGAPGNTTNTTSSADIASLETVNISAVNGIAAATTTVALGANLTASQAIYAGTYDPATSANNMASGNVSPNFSRAVRVFDAQGRGHDLQIAFLKTALNTWQVEVFANPASDVTVGAGFVDGQVGTGTITFNGDGTLNSVSAGLSNPMTMTWTTGASASSIAFDWGTAGAIGTGLANGLSQFDGAYNVAFVNQNGSEVGELNGVSITAEGYVVASFSNGETQRLYKLPIATFADVTRLEARTGNVFAQTEGSGQFNLRESGRGGAGIIAPSSLEAANVDIGKEFTDMIVTQRAFAASSRVITTADDMLDELIRIRR
jgi:flagellar hook protein FlgE